MHVDAAYSADLMGLSSDGDIGYDPRVLNQAARLVLIFTQHHGTDITIASPNNEHWHTGNPVRLAAGSAKQYRPDEYLWQVESGVSAGKDAAAQCRPKVSAWAEQGLGGWANLRDRGPSYLFII